MIFLVRFDFHLHCHWNHEMLESRIVKETLSGKKEV
jgi:hypothetical protein